MRIGFLMILLPAVMVVSTTSLSYAISDCYYAGVNFSDGAVSCQSGHQFECSNGDWKSLDLSCVTPPPIQTIENPSACSCTTEELTACDQAGKSCCVSLIAGSCSKKCCPK